MQLTRIIQSGAFLHFREWLELACSASRQDWLDSVSPVSMSEYQKKAAIGSSGRCSYSSGSAGTTGLQRCLGTGMIISILPPAECGPLNASVILRQTILAGGTADTVLLIIRCVELRRVAQILSNRNIEMATKCCSKRFPEQKVSPPRGIEEWCRLLLAVAGICDSSPTFLAPGVRPSGSLKTFLVSTQPCVCVHGRGAVSELNDFVGRCLAAWLIRRRKPNSGQFGMRPYPFQLCAFPTIFLHL